MKPLFWRNVLTLVPSIAALMLASQVAMANPNNSSDGVVNTRPFNLVRLGYQGYFKDEGIPSHSAFYAAIQSRRVTATQLVESAVKKGKLDRDVLNNQEYLESVETQLELMLRSRR